VVVGCALATRGVSVPHRGWRGNGATVVHGRPRARATACPGRVPPWPNTGLIVGIVIAVIVVVGIVVLLLRRKPRAAEG